MEDKETPNNDKIFEETIHQISGDEGIKVYFILKGKENVSEFVISEHLNITINQVRNILYKFEKYGLVSSTRKKDRKKGWYIYYWTINNYKIEDLIIAIKKKKLEKYKILIEKEKNNRYYFCPKKCMRLNFESAFENQFQCMECGQLLQPEDQEKIISKLKKQIEDLDEELKILNKKRDERVFEEEEKKKPSRKTKKQIKTTKKKAKTVKTKSKPTKKTVKKNKSIKKKSKNKAK